MSASGLPPPSLHAEILDETDMAASVFGRTGRLVYANAKFREIHAAAGDIQPGMAFAEIIGAILTLLPEGRREQTLQMLSRLVAEPDSCDREIGTAEGRFFRYRFRPFGADQTLFTLRNITAQRLSQTLAEEKSALLEALLAHVPAGVTIYDTDERLLLANDLVQEIWRLDRTLEIGEPHVALSRHIVAMDAALSAVDDPGEREAWLADKLSAIRRDLAERDVSEEYLRLTDGRVVHIRRRLTPAGHRVSTVVDATDLFRAIDEMKRSEARYRAIVEDQSEYILRFSPGDQALTFVNGAFCARVGLAADALLGRPIGEVMGPERAARLSAALAKLTPEKPLAESDVGLAGPGGAQLFEHWTDRAVFDAAGEVLEYQSVGRDITETRIAQDALAQTEKMSALGSLLASVAHELNNPLAVVLGQAELMIELAPDPATSKRASRVQKAAQRCKRIVETFLAMARQKPPSRTAIDLADVVRGAVELTGYALRTSDIELSEELAPDLPLVHADADQITQVLVNLLINAQQALSDTPPPRQISLTTRCLGDDMVALEIADTGPGVPQEIKARIFEPFFTTKPEGSGTGIGLSVSSNIVRSHGGALTVADNVPSGARFRIALPVHASAPDAAAPGAPASERAAGGGLRVLVVDDEPEIAETISEMLALDGHRAEVATSGYRALAVLAKQDVDVVISDVRMPDLDGPGLYRALGQLHPHLQARTGFVTGDTLNGPVRRFLEETRRPVLEKPFNRQEFRRLLGELVGDQAG